ncbi:MULTISPECIES: antitoxin [Shouchella]|uniref:Antitoxin n=2 Tax=Shouchella TaxID=2893057 RepID=A0ABY7WAE8_9BACI|nr:MULTISPECIES: antitoxin [Bacillaceae]MED4126712.1 antitoxin [Shouchella miscanthi]WDF04589.1 antitoxin [Shouchella hunanensis]
MNEVDIVLEQEKWNDPRLKDRAELKAEIRESMQQGYMEMAKINLTIASEAFLAEEEANHTLTRLVSGV